MACDRCEDGVIQTDGYPLECPCENGGPVVSNWKFAVTHDLQWKPGTYGKGWVIEDGSVWTWPVSEGMRKPWHMEKSYKMKQLGLRPMKSEGGSANNSAFEISPEGTVSRLSKPLAPEFLEAILAADPNLHNPEDDPWRLSKVIPEPRWVWSARPVANSRRSD